MLFLLLFSFLSAVLLHECGHLTALVFCRAQMIRFRVSPFGMTITHSALPSPLAAFFVASCGPLFGVIGYVVSHCSGHFPVFSLISLYLSLFNLLPITTLDGSRMASAILHYLLPPHRAEQIARGLSRITLLLLWLVGVYIFFILDSSPSLFLMALTLFFQGKEE